MVAAITMSKENLEDNIGVMSDYFHHGIEQESSAVTNGSIVYLNGGRYRRTWATDGAARFEVNICTAIAGS